jgi:hypothetical protein
MRSRGAYVLLGGVILLTLTVALSLVAIGFGRYRGAPAAAPLRPLAPEELAQAYLGAWQDGDFETMMSLVATPPADFVERHRRLSSDLRATRVRFDAAKVVRDADRARVDFAVTWTLGRARCVALPLEARPRPVGRALEGRLDAGHRSSRLTDGRVAATGRA